MLRGRFRAIQAHLKKQEKSQINNLTLHLKQLEKEEMKDLRVSRRKEILKIRAEINAKEKKETIAKINKAKIWFFEKINKIDKPLARHIKKQKEKNQINKIRNEKSRGYNRQHRHTKDHKTITSNYMPIRASLVAQLVKNLLAVWETWVQPLGWKDPPEKGKATHSSILA